jgi:hypothetical protein
MPYKNKNEILKQILLEQVLPDLQTIVYGKLEVLIDDGEIKDWFAVHHKKPKRVLTAVPKTAKI